MLNVPPLVVSVLSSRPSRRDALHAASSGSTHHGRFTTSDANAVARVSVSNPPTDYSATWI
jgi:hypothetical protein